MAGCFEKQTSINDQSVRLDVMKADLDRMAAEGLINAEEKLAASKAIAAEKAEAARIAALPPDADWQDFAIQALEIAGYGGLGFGTIAAGLWRRAKRGENVAQDATEAIVRAIETSKDPSNDGKIDWVKLAKIQHHAGVTGTVDTIRDKLAKEIKEADLAAGNGAA